MPTAPVAARHDVAGPRRSRCTFGRAGPGGRDAPSADSSSDPGRTSPDVATCRCRSGSSEKRWRAVAGGATTGSACRPTGSASDRDADAGRPGAAATHPAPSAAPAAPPAVAAAPRPTAAVEQTAVIANVQEYTQAYDAMDVSAAAAVWPSVDRRALARAFGTLKSQDLRAWRLRGDDPGGNATARCRGTVAYVRKVGDSTPRTGHQQWVFRMRKIGDEWIIDTLDASPIAALSPSVARGPI